MAILRLSHIGLCVSDLERSRQFYCELLGFRERSSLEVKDAAAARLLQLAEVELQAVYLERDGTFLELLHYRVPGSTGDAKPAPMNRLGLTHLSLRVDDFDAVVERLAEAGVALREDTRVDNPVFQAKAIMLSDPDGQNIELYQSPGNPELPPGA